MTIETYKTLSEKEKLMYDELVGFASRLTAHMDEISDLLTRILAEADK